MIMQAVTLRVMVLALAVELKDLPKVIKVLVSVVLVKVLALVMGISNLQPMFIVIKLQEQQ